MNKKSVRIGKNISIKFTMRGGGALFGGSCEGGAGSILVDSFREVKAWSRAVLLSSNILFKASVCFVFSSSMRWVIAGSSAFVFAFADVENQKLIINFLT